MASKFFAAAVLLIVVAASAQAQEAPSPAPSPAQAALCPSRFMNLEAFEMMATQLRGQVVYAVVNSPLMNSTVDGLVTGLRSQYPTQEICVCAPNIGRLPPRSGTGPVVFYICNRA